ncbi:uncharacterized protein LOC118410000 [Branchiostoma floridae]|uniref:Uncharacterized protein LOC118410000 n=1 Tax=Branchiostoma floridae TaxID=7739 RepID=A0A9J7KNL8_BRAFL|nr:uncharacterized protein LOC118410000 [Branchiostoma floridae]
MGGTSEDKTALIAGSAGGGAAVLLVICAVVAFCIIRKRSSTMKKENNPTASMRMDDVGTNVDSTSGGTNPSFPPSSVQLDALYAKPDKKKKKQQQPGVDVNPDDPSYQDVIPTGAQHQYATVQDDPHPYTAVRDEPNLYDSIQDDPQYATVQKGRKLDPNVETNPLYGKGSVDNTTYDPGSLSNDKDRVPSVCEMVDNVIYG